MGGLQRSAVLLGALRAVRDGVVVCHGPGARAPGWAWRDGGDTPLPTQEALSELHHARLIDVNRSGRWHVDGDPVVLTRSGTDRLSWWTARQVAS